MAATGPATVESIRRFHFDLAIVGACSFDPEAGVTTRSRREVASKQAFIVAAAEVLVPLESTKLNTVSSFHIAAPTEVGILVTKAALEPKVHKQWSSAGIHITAV